MTALAQAIKSPPALAQAFRPPPAFAGFRALACAGRRALSKAFVSGGSVMSVIRAACLALLPFWASASLAQSAPAPMNVPGVSAAGNAVLTKLWRAPDPGFRMILGQLKDISAQLQLESQRPEVDVDTIAALLKKREGLAAQSLTRQNDRTVAALKALPVEDRGPFLRAISRSIGAAPAATPAR